MTRPLAHRRHVALALIAGLVPSPLFACIAPHQQAVRALLPHIRAARIVGERYLAIAPQERCTTLLITALFGGALPPISDGGALAHLRQIIEARRQQDFATGETVMLDGWLLARTEARLCALAVAA